MKNSYSYSYAAVYTQHGSFNRKSVFLHLKCLFLLLTLLQSTASAIDQTPITGSNFPNKVVALTYDDGPDDYTLALAQYLHNHKISATFNVVAYHDGATDNRGYLKQDALHGNNGHILSDIVALGHRLSNHTYEHNILPCLTNQEVIDSLYNNHLYISQHTSTKMFLFGPPGAHWTSSTAPYLPGSDSTCPNSTTNVYSVIVGNQDLSSLIGPVSPTDFHGINAMDWYYAQQSWTPQQYANDFLNYYFGGGIQFPHIFFHDANSYAIGADYVLQLTQSIIPVFESQGYVFAAPVLQFSPITSAEQFPDSDGWNLDSYYAGFRAGDVNGDGLVDVCARGTGGMYCSFAHISQSTGLGISPQVSFEAKQLLESTEFTDTSGWSNVTYNSTIQLGDVNGDGKADIVARNSAGIIVALANSSGNGFQPRQYWSYLNSNGKYDFSDFENIWQTDASYYKTFQLADVNGDGKADLCVRGTQGILCALSTGNSFGKYSYWVQSEFSDALGWKNVVYASTIHFADVNGDGKADVVGRNSAGIVVALANGSGTGFLTASQWTAEFSNSENIWQTDASYYGTFRLADLNGDGKADLCARGQQGLVCALSNGSSFTSKVNWKSDDFTDAIGWNNPRYSSSLMLADINGDKRADLLGRNTSGIIFGFAP